MELRIYKRPGAPAADWDDSALRRAMRRWRPRWLDQLEDRAGASWASRRRPIMEMIVYGHPVGPGEQKPRWRPRWLAEFDRWAAPEAGPEHEAERSFFPVGALLGLALLGQYAQLWIPSVHAYLVQHDILERANWAVYMLFKGAALFVLVLLALAIREERLESIGFPRLDARRLALALGLVGLALGAALLRDPNQVLQQSGIHYLIPIWPGERVLWVALAISAAVMEETFFRGFAIVWTYRWSGQLLLSVLFPAIVFAAGHAYLGWLNVGFALGAALFFSGLFLWKRDLYWPMVIHFVVNVLVLFA